MNKQRFLFASLTLVPSTSRQSDRSLWAYVPWWRSPNRSPWLRSWRGSVNLTTSMSSSSLRRWSWRNLWRSGRSATASSPSTPKVNSAYPLQSAEWKRWCLNNCMQFLCFLWLYFKHLPDTNPTSRFYFHAFYGDLCVLINEFILRVSSLQNSQATVTIYNSCRSQFVTCNVFPLYF